MSWKDRAKPAAEGWKSRAKMIEAARAEAASSEPDGADPRTASGALLRGFGQGASLGFADEIGGALMSGLAGAADLGQQLAGASDAEREDLRYRLTGAAPGESAYQKVRDEARKENAAARQESPWLYGASELAGGLAVPAPKLSALAKVPLLGRALASVGKAGAGAVTAAQRFAGVPVAPMAKTVLGKALAMGGQGAATGALAGAGHSEGVDAGEVASDTLLGGTVGGALGGGLSLAGNAARAVAPGALSDLAERMAIKSLGRAGISNKLAKNADVRTQAQMQSLGRELLNNDVLRATPAKTLERALSVLDDSGASIGDAISAREVAAAAGVAPKASLLPTRIMVEEQMRQQAARAPTREAPARAIADRVKGALGYAPGQAEPPRTFRQLWQAKSDLQRSLKPQEMSRLEDELYRDAVAATTRNIYSQMEAGLTPTQVDSLRQSARTYATAAKARKLLADEVTREGLRSPVGLLDAEIANALAPGGGLTAAAIGAASSALRNRAPYAVAKTADALSSALRRKAPSLLPEGINAGGGIAALLGGRAEQQQREGQDVEINALLEALRRKGQLP